MVHVEEEACYQERQGIMPKKGGLQVKIVSEETLYWYIVYCCK